MTKIKKTEINNKNNEDNKNKELRKLGKKRNGDIRRTKKQGNKEIGR